MKIIKNTGSAISAGTMFDHRRVSESVKLSHDELSENRRPTIPNIPILTWWLIPLSKWVITPVINGISRVNPLMPEGKDADITAGDECHDPPQSLIETRAEKKKKTVDERYGI